uniref:Uncharacterized protein n=1 Tax=viral metagenome TaxID=1070528 RepID=A0A6C0AR95_9ZZZZ
MPYFKSDQINLLLIHIPKTGGTSLETYFSSKYNISLDEKSLYTNLELDQDILKLNIQLFSYMLPELYKYIANYIEKKNIDINSSLQHLKYSEILTYKDFFQIDFDNLKILSVVRNPYTRLVSDLFYYNLIDTDTSKDTVYETITKCLESANGTYDNHFIPQYTYITDENGVLIDNLQLLKQETLNENMTSLGYDDFNLLLLKNKNTIDYYSYLNSNSIALINSFYDKDFELFGYSKL